MQGITTERPLWKSCGSHKVEIPTRMGTRKKFYFQKVVSRGPRPATNHFLEIEFLTGSHSGGDFHFVTTAGFPQGSLGCNPLHLSNRRVTFLKICPLPPVDKITMLSKCANPCCSAPFRYLSRGKLYRWDTSAAAKGKELSFGTDAQAQSATRRIEFFWLCEQCAPTMT